MAAKKKRKSYPRAESNPFRDSSPPNSYAIIYDILAAHPEGIDRKILIDKATEILGKERRLVRLDSYVVTSMDKSGKGAHQSVRNKDGYWVEKLPNHFLKLHLRDASSPRFGVVKFPKRD